MTSQSILTCTLITTSYVGAVVAWNTKSTENTLLAKRTISISIVAYISHYIAGSPAILRDISDLVPLVAGTGITGILFLAEILLSTKADWNRRIGLPLRVLIKSIVIAPVLEEIVFRLHFTRLLQSSGHGKVTTFMVGAALFWVAHFHKLLLAKELGLAGAASLLYTFAFGGLAFVLLDKFGSVVAPIASHMVCNLLQVPNLGRGTLYHVACIAATVAILVFL